MGGAMLSKSLIQFSVDGWGCVPSLLFDLRPNYGGGNEDKAPSKGPVHELQHSVFPTLQQATANPCLYQRLLDTHGQVWASLLWGLYSYLLLCKYNNERHLLLLLRSLKDQSNAFSEKAWERGEESSLCVLEQTANQPEGFKSQS